MSCADFRSLNEREAAALNPSISACVESSLVIAERKIALSYSSNARHVKLSPRTLAKKITRVSLRWMDPLRTNAISKPSVTVDYRLRKRLPEGVPIDTRPFTGLHATDQCQGSVSSLSLLLSMVSCFGSLDKISVFGNSRLRVPDWNNVSGASRRSPSLIANTLTALMLASCANGDRKRARTHLRLDRFTNSYGKSMKEINRRLLRPFDRTPRENSRTTLS